MKSLDIALKDMLRSFRSLFAIGMMVVVPLLITGLIYFAFSGLMSGGGQAASLSTLSVVVANLDRPPAGGPELGKLVVTSLHDQRLPSWLKVSEVPSEADARSAIDQQHAGAAVIIPADFSQQLTSPNGHSSLTVLKDPTLKVGPAVLQTILEQVASGLSGARIAVDVANARAQARGVALDAAASQDAAMAYAKWISAVPTNSTQGGVLLVQPPASAAAAEQARGPFADVMAKIMAGMMIFFAFYGGAFTALSIVREDEEGTLARLFSTPTSRATILGGKFLAVFFTLIVQVLVLIVASSLAFHISWGQPASMALAAVGLVVAAAGFGVLVVSFIKTSKQAGPVLGGLLTVVGMLGGLFTVAVQMPPAFTSLTLFTPHGWAMRGWQLAMSGGDAGALLPVVLVELALGAAFLALGVALFRRRFA